MIHIEIDQEINIYLTPPPPTPRNSDQIMGGGQLTPSNFYQGKPMYFGFLETELDQIMGGGQIDVYLLIAQKGTELLCIPYQHQRIEVIRR